MAIFNSHVKLPEGSPWDCTSIWDVLEAYNTYKLFSDLGPSEAKAATLFEGGPAKQAYDRPASALPPLLSTLTESSWLRIGDVFEA